MNLKELKLIYANHFIFNLTNYCYLTVDLKNLEISSTVENENIIIHFNKRYFLIKGADYKTRNIIPDIDINSYEISFSYSMDYYDIEEVSLQMSRIMKVNKILT